MIHSGERREFGWRARAVRSLLVLLFALVSVLLVEWESILIIKLGELWRLRELLSEDPGERGFLDLPLAAPLDPAFWIIYAVLGLPIAALHALSSLAWHPALPWFRAHCWLTAVAGLAMLIASFADPFFSFAFAVLLLSLAHIPCMAAPALARRSARVGPSDRSAMR